MGIMTDFLRSPVVWLVVIGAATAYHLCLWVRDIMAELSLRRDTVVEEEVLRRMDTADVPIAHPATPESPSQDREEWLLSSPETYPSYNTHAVYVLLGVFFLVCVITAAYASQWYDWMLLILAPMALGAILWMTIRKPSLVWRVRREVRIARVANRHSADYVTVDHPGQGWDLSGVEGRVEQASKEWSGEATSLFETKPVEVIRSSSRPCFEYGMERINTKIYRFYILAETMPLPYMAIKRQMKLSPRQQRQRIDQSRADQAYAVAPGCEAAFSRLSRRTQELMVAIHVNTMVLDRGWAVLWWDGRLSGRVDFGKGQNWDARMDMSSEQTWESVKKVRALLASIENDLAFGGSG